MAQGGRVFAKIGRVLAKALNPDDGSMNTDHWEESVLSALCRSCLGQSAHGVLYPSIVHCEVQLHARVPVTCTFLACFAI